VRPVGHAALDQPLIILVVAVWPGDEAPRVEVLRAVHHSCAVAAPPPVPLNESRP